MQTKFKSSILGIAMLTSCFSLFSFTTNFGGDSLEVWINNKMVLQQFMHIDKSVKNIVLQESNYNDKISFRYSHCGQQGKQRTIILKDARDKVLKSMTFSNSSGNSMTFNVKDIMDTQTPSSRVIRIYYTSEEIPTGKLLVSMTRSGAGVASR